MLNQKVKFAQDAEGNEMNRGDVLSGPSGILPQVTWSCLVWSAAK